MASAEETDHKRLREAVSNLRKQIRTLEEKAARQQEAHAQAMRAREREEQKRIDAWKAHEKKVNKQIARLQAEASKPADVEVVKERDQARAAVTALKRDLERAEGRRRGAQADAESKGLALDEAERELAKAGIRQNPERSENPADPEKLRDCPEMLAGYVMTLRRQRDEARKELDVRTEELRKAQPAAVQA